MVYVCREGTTCECNSSWLPRFKLPGPVSSEEDFDSSSSASLNMWTEVVEHYSRRHISFHQDRLPAISSLASFYEEAAGRYLAGLWESHLPECLLWWTDRGHRPEPSNSSMSYPPSWSWASTEGAVITRSSGETWLPTASVLDVSVHPSTSDPKGLVSGGYITIQGHLLPLQSSWHRDDLENDYTFRQYNINCHTTWQAGDGLEWTDGHAWHCSLDNIGSLRPLPKAGEFDTPVFLLIIGTSNHGGLHKSYRTFEGLILKPVENLNELQMKATKRFGSELACVRFGLGMLRLRAHSVDLPKDCTKTVTIF
ncbi:hypothetical protein BKA66DRAFT_231698 [Pyrenochaeta sp. MPI-SDFR-AT-0127]|nr:hypothetical protein BKA66DRAFT_231698 [Pyrenochaeta sp. MPI-SDFR-AT-0127]